MQILALGPDDAASYRALMLEAYERHPQAFTSSVAERASMPLQWWASRLDGTQERVLGGYVGSELAGFVGLAFEPRENARHKVTLFGLYVSREFRHTGLGQLLVEAALVEARRLPHLKVMQLTVTAGNDEAFRLYRRCGFTQFGLESLAVRVGEEYFDKIHMGLALNA